MKSLTKDLDPGVHKHIREKVSILGTVEPDRPMTDDEIRALLEAFIAQEEKFPGTLSLLKRIGGGASKEQFIFELTHGSSTTKYVLRMDPVLTASETDREREFEVLREYSTEVPTPTALWMDDTGRHFGRPVAIMNFVPGVIKPSQTISQVAGFGVAFPERLRKPIAEQFVDLLARIHNVDHSVKDLTLFTAPTEDDEQPARWQLNWWNSVWEEFSLYPFPIAEVARDWLGQNIPRSTNISMVHGDYRIGNIMFDESSGEVTAVLDWEYAHLGDFHEDLAWAVQPLYSVPGETGPLMCGLLVRDELLLRYEQASGRTINPQTLRWYEVLGAYKCLSITLATSLKAAAGGYSHQDALLSWLAGIGHYYTSQIFELINGKE